MYRTEEWDDVCDGRSPEGEEGSGRHQENRAVRVHRAASCRQESTEGRAGHPVWCEPERARAVFWGQRERLGEAAKQPGISPQALRRLQ